MMWNQFLLKAKDLLGHKFMTEFTLPTNSKVIEGNMYIRSLTKI